MRKRVIAYAALSLMATAGGALGFLWMRSPEMRPASSARISATEERLERGKYLFESVLDCDGCHSPRDFSRFGGPVILSKRGAGVVMPAEMGLPGTVAPPNITSDPDTGIGQWTDGEVLRAIREGVSRDGRALFPMMPYEAYRNLSDEDASALVVYLRTLPPVHSDLPKTKVAFPVNLMIKFAPKPVERMPEPDRMDKAGYGKYLVSIAGCVGCHTPAVRGQLDESKLFAGGHEFRMGGATVVSANITPDTQTGLGKLSEDQFVEKFAQYRGYVANGAPRVGRDGFTLMPWLGYARMDDGDLRALYSYMKSVKPVLNSVETHPEK